MRRIGSSPPSGHPCGRERRRARQAAQAHAAVRPAIAPRALSAVLCVAVLLGAGIAACASPPRGVPPPAAATLARSEGHWPRTTVAERTFPSADVAIGDVAIKHGAIKGGAIDDIVIEDRGRPWKLWLMAAPAGGATQALEFFSGERVADVQAAPIDAAAPDGRMAYSFTDRSGRRHVSVRGTASTVDPDRPAAYGGWQDREGRGHDVVLGGVLFDAKIVTGPDGVAESVNTPIDVRRWFGGQPICETAAYVARTRAPLRQETAPGFRPLTKIIADYVPAQRCWTTRPSHAVNLDDNTLLIVVGRKAVRLNARDLSPAGRAPGIRIVDIRE